MKLSSGILLLVLLLTGCAHRPDSVEQQQARIAALAQQLQTQAPQAPPHRARQLARVAVTTADNLREQYGVRLTPWLHNVEVNSGTRSRGLCFHYARDLAAALKPVMGPDWELHYVQAHPKSIFEHNAIVITAPGKPWTNGIVLDGWRNAGVLYFGPVSDDQYPWQLKTRNTGNQLTTSGHQE